MIESAAPDSFLSVPEPILILDLVVSPAPRTETVPNPSSDIDAVVYTTPPNIAVPYPVSVTDITSDSLVPMKEKSICFSSGLTVIDSAVPL